MGTHHSDTHVINYDKLEYDLADFYLYFHSFSKRTLSEVEECPRLWELLYVKFEYDLSSKLINISSQLRVLDNRASLFLSENKNQKLSQKFTCGTLKKDDIESVLNLREAFNKILHCDSLFKSKIHGFTDSDILNLKLSSEEAWHVTIDLNQFVFASINFIQDAGALLYENNE